MNLPWRAADNVDEKPKQDCAAGPSGFIALNAYPAQQSDPPMVAVAPVVVFARSGITVPWDNRYESLMELADDHAIDISAGCRYGDCGTCLTPLLQGTVAYNHRTGITPDAATCLPCSCRPSTSIVLDL